MGETIMNPSAFQIGREIGTNFGNSFKQVKDENLIENIIQESMASGSPEVLQNNIGKILSQVSPERQGPAIQYLQNAYGNIQKKQEEQKRINSLQKEGINPYLPEKLQVEKYKQDAKGKRLENVYGIAQQDQQGINSANPNTVMPNGINIDETNPFSKFTDGQLVRLSGAEDKEIGEPAKQELKRRQEERNLENEKAKNKIKFGEKIAEKVLVAADETAASLPQKQTALNLMNEAITNRDLSFWSWDNIAEKTGIEGLRSPEGALFKTAAKEYFLGSIARAGTRPNQWIEQQIADMLTKIGRSTAANLSVSRALQNELDLEKERVRLTDEVATELEDTGGNLRRLGSIVNERLSGFAENKQRELFNDLRAIKSIEEKKPQVFHKVTEGTQMSNLVGQALLKQYNNDPRKARIEAKKLGYVF